LDFRVVGIFGLKVGDNLLPTERHAHNTTRALAGKKVDVFRSGFCIERRSELWPSSTQSLTHGLSPSLFHASLDFALVLHLISGRPGPGGHGANGGFSNPFFDMAGLRSKLALCKHHLLLQFPAIGQHRSIPTCDARAFLSNDIFVRVKGRTRSRSRFRNIACRNIPYQHRNLSTSRSSTSEVYHTPKRSRFAQIQIQPSYKIRRPCYIFDD
jgi:hypothetical protein